MALLNHLRPPANQADWWYIFELRNSKHVRAASANTAPITMVQHLQWIERHAENTDGIATFLYIRPNEGSDSRVGVVTLSLDKDDVCTWSFYMREDVQGKKYGGKMLDLAMAHAAYVMKAKKIKGLVRMDNAASQHLHLARGFTRYAVSDKLWEYTKDLT